MPGAFTARSLRRVFTVALAAGVTVAFWTLLTTSEAPSRHAPSAERRWPDDPEALARHLEDEPGDAEGWRRLATLWLEAGERRRAREAIARAESALRDRERGREAHGAHRDAATWAALASLRHELGDHEPSRALYARAADALAEAADRGDGSRTSFQLACYAALAGQRERALRTLEDAAAGGSLRRGWLRDDRLAPLRDDPRFRALLSGGRRERPADG